MRLAELISPAPHAEERIFSAIETSGAPVVLFGAGDLACYVDRYLRWRGITPERVCDNDPSKQGTTYLGLPVCGYEELHAVYGPAGVYNLVLAVGERGRTAVLDQLAEAGERNPVWTLTGFELCGDKLDHAFFEAHEGEFEEAFSLLEDERSRRVFVNVLNARLTGDFGLFEQKRSSRRNFDPEVLTLAGGDVLVDVGAYLGDGVLAFRDASEGRYERIIAFEPDPVTAAALRERLAACAVRGVEVRAVAAWSERTELGFSAGRAGSSRVSADGGEGTAAGTLQADTIDDVLGGRRVTHIFMDVEGAEHAAILGAAASLARWRPQVAISAYHRREDLFDLPLLLRSIVPGYRFYLRHYMGDQTETVLYGV